MIFNRKGAIVLKNQKKTLQERLQERKIKDPSRLLYWILMPVVKILNWSIHTEFHYKANPGQDKGPFVIIANHASRNDYLFTAPVCLPNRLNYVVGYNEFFRFPLCIILKLMQAIPKKNFTPDTYTIRQIMAVIRRGGHICIMPEGMSSITGMCQPVIPGGAKLLKKLGVNVYYSKISGGYLTYTKHCLDTRPGKVSVTVDRMFSAEELKTLSVEEIEDTMNRLLAHDDYIWNKQAQVSYRVKGGMAQKLDTLLYLCPKCGAVYHMETEGDRMRCTCCGNTVELDDKYNLRPVGEGSVCPELVTDWTIAERSRAAELVRQEGFCHSGRVKIGTLLKYRNLTGGATSSLCGEGMLTLTKEGLSYEGTRDGAPWSFRIPPAQLPTYGMCTDISRFYTFVEGEFVEFYPENNDVLLWDHLTEELHRAAGGKWQNTDYRHTPD